MTINLKTMYMNTLHVFNAYLDILLSGMLKYEYLKARDVKVLRKLNDHKGHKKDHQKTIQVNVNRHS